MANTSFSRDGASHANLIPQKWTKKDFVWALENNPLRPYMGTGENSIIKVNKNLLKEQGDKLTFPLMSLLTGDGQGDDGAYEGNEEGQVFYDDSAQLHERGHSTQLAGKMTEQSAYDKLRKRGRKAMRRWYSRVLTSDSFAALSGMPCMKFAGRQSGEVAVDIDSNALKTVNQVAVSKSATAMRWFGGGQNSSGVVTRVATDALINNTSTMIFGTLVIDYLKRMAQNSIDSSDNEIPAIRPVMVDGEEHYLMLINRLQMKALRAETAWKEAQQYANIRGHKNPIFSGASGIWNGVVIRETDYTHRRTGAGGNSVSEAFDLTSDPCANGFTVVRSLFLGAESLNLGWGMMPVWEDGFVDWQKTKWGTFTNFIYCVKKAQFNSLDHGCIVADTAVIAD